MIAEDFRKRLASYYLIIGGQVTRRMSRLQKEGAFMRLAKASLNTVLYVIYKICKAFVLWYEMEDE